LRVDGTDFRRVVDAGFKRVVQKAGDIVKGKTSTYSSNFEIANLADAAIPSPIAVGLSRAIYVDNLTGDRNWRLVGVYWVRHACLLQSSNHMGQAA